MKITIKSDAVFEQEIKKSRFIASLAGVETEEAARAFIDQVRSQHPKANHNVFAFTIGDQQNIQRMSDDGEPSGTAAVPMLEILKKRQIINVCAVVTRYFGGIKLGAGGLIRAYAGTLNQAVDQVGLVALKPQQELILTVNYSQFDSLSHFLVIGCCIDMH